MRCEIKASYPFGLRYKRREEENSLMDSNLWLVVLKDTHVQRMFLFIIHDFLWLSFKKEPKWIQQRQCKITNKNKPGRWHYADLYGPTQVEHFLFYSRTDHRWPKRWGKLTTFQGEWNYIWDWQTQRALRITQSVHQQYNDLSMRFF